MKRARISKSTINERAARPLPRPGDGPRSRPPRSPASVALLSFAAALSACGSDGDGGNTPVQQGSAFTYEVADPCTAKAPEPSDVFRGSDGVSERASCSPPADPIEAALVAALADEGAALDSTISIPFSGKLDAATLTSSAAFELTTATATSAAPIPPTLLLSSKLGTSTSSLAAGWNVLAHHAEATDAAITIVPDAPLAAGGYYVAVVTDLVKDGGKPSKALTLAPATKALLSTTPIVAGAFEGLDAAGAARLERERLRLAPIVTLLEQASPPIPRSRIRSIQGFGTALGFARTRQAANAYYAAITAGTIPYQLEAVGGDIAPADLYPTSTPASAYDHVRAFRRGTISVPRVLDAEGHLRPDWATNVQMVKIPFLVSLPVGGGGYRLVIYLPGFGRSKLDAREVANNFASAPRAAVFGLDLRCHGDRALDASGACKEERTAAEIAALTDQTSNGNPERTGADGVPDDSGAGFFSGDARALRDGQLAAIIEVMHVVQTFQRGTAAATAAGIQSSGTDVHLLAHGHSAAIALTASALTRAPVRTVSLASGGAGIPRLVLDGPAAVKEAFLASAPSGITASNLEAYLGRLDQTVLAGVSFAEAGALAKERYIRMAGGSPRILLAHGERAEFVPLAARQTVISTLGLDQLDKRVSAHHGECDDFYLHTCKLGDNIAWGERARDQLGTFVSSNGVTVLDPAL